MEENKKPKIKRVHILLAVLIALLVPIIVGGIGMCQLIVGKNPLFKKSSMFCGALPFQNGSLASASLPQAFYRGCLQHSDPFLLGYDSICLEMMVNPVAACGALCAGLTIISGQINCDQAEMDHYAPMAHSVQGNAVRRCFL